MVAAAAAVAWAIPHSGSVRVDLGDTLMDSVVMHAAIAVHESHHSEAPEREPRGLFVPPWPWELPPLPLGGTSMQSRRSAVGWDIYAVEKVYQTAFEVFVANNDKPPGNMLRKSRMPCSESSPNTLLLKLRRQLYLQLTCLRREPPHMGLPAVLLQVLLQILPPIKGFRWKIGLPSRLPMLLERLQKLLVVVIIFTTPSQRQLWRQPPEEPANTLLLQLLLRFSRPLVCPTLPLWLNIRTGCCRCRRCLRRCA